MLHLKVCLSMEVLRLHLLCSNLPLFSPSSFVGLNKWPCVIVDRSPFSCKKILKVLFGLRRWCSGSSNCYPRIMTWVQVQFTHMKATRGAGLSLQGWAETSRSSLPGQHMSSKFPKSKIKEWWRKAASVNLRFPWHTPKGEHTHPIINFSKFN